MVQGRQQLRAEGNLWEPQYTGSCDLTLKDASYEAVARGLPLNFNNLVELFKSQMNNRLADPSLSREEKKSIDNAFEILRRK
jgi:hypothetical protein